MTAVERLLKYVAVDTQSDPRSTNYPSAQKELVLTRMLKDELISLGLSDVNIDKYGYLTAFLPARGTEKTKTLALLAHVDTSFDISGKNVNARVIEYNGGDIILNDKLNIVTKEAEFPALKKLCGKHLVVTDGTTLLGGDDKAGIAIIMTLLEYYQTNIGVAHPALKIAFTPDEEIGMGTEYFDVKAFGADFGYTVDGGVLGSIEFENFNAAAVEITVNGVNIHPGSAKNKMKNAVLIANQLIGMLPESESPAHTEGREGFYHINSIEGNVELCRMEYLIRDHDSVKFAERKRRMQEVCQYLNGVYGDGTVVLNMQDSYYNMKERILPHYHLVENAFSAMKKHGITPDPSPIRGGTDGARLSFEGLPCPNLCTGTDNMHGRHEYTCVEDMQLMVSVIKDIFDNYI